MCQDVEFAMERNLSKFRMQFEDIQQEFIKSEEISRSSRQSAIDLKEEYCRVVFSVAAERRRNQLHIEATKQEFMKDLDSMNTRINIVDDFLREVKELKEE